MGVSCDDMGSLDSNTGNMTNTLKFTPILIAAAAVAAIAAAPFAAADTPGAQTACSTGAPDTMCQSPGNVEINDSPGAVQDQPLYPYWEGGDFGGYRGGGGFHGGGGGGHR
ncbi:MAG: hypothetical protein QOH60_4616 [Mycobacterium sp.]|jgi:hypothetical protein|nr:hypothetical protein [Mycobacterium sp.]